MAINLDLPNITANNPAGQIAQLKSYLYQMVQQLQWAFSTVEASSGISVERPVAFQGATMTENIRSFDELKALIIKSADIVEAYYGQIDSLLSLSGHYVAESDFGVYREETENKISANHTAIQQTINREQVISETVDGISSMLRSQESYIRYGSVGTTLDETGMAASSAPGIEIGDFHSMEDGTGTVINKRFARFTAYGLELFGANKDAAPVAYIKQQKLYITNAEITSSLKLGGYVVDSTDGLLFDWVGG